MCDKSSRSTSHKCASRISAGSQTKAVAVVIACPSSVVLDTGHPSPSYFALLTFESRSRYVAVRFNLYYSSPTLPEKKIKKKYSNKTTV